ncbi:MAG TPA: DUF4254 domain-containing protein [Flavobacteriaceae bacterium]|jgi:hypothetical protein|nr:DUF4254 domain-containing protein [Flavobacteriaceae bacterium]
MDDIKISNSALEIFQQSVDDYHKHDDINQPIQNPHPDTSLSHLLYKKNWIDTVQWHYEDIIRDPNINPEKGMEIKRKIDKSNQDRTEMVEYIDSYFLNKFSQIVPKEQASINSESPAWVLDRLSILVLKIYHMDEEYKREGTGEEHKESCKKKLDILLEQRKDLAGAIDDLLTDISTGDKKMKVYKQMKMYNDESLNPILYKNNE